MSPASPLHVVITGASGGLGAALARHYASRGAALGLTARSPGEMEALAGTYPGRCIYRTADVRDAVAMREAAAHFREQHDLADIVIANAGISVGTLTEFAEDERSFRDVIDTNLIGMVNTFQPYLGAMRERGSGILAGIASVAGYRGLPGAGAYSASKAAAISYLESLRVELRDSGVSVITLCPGYIVTAMTARNPYPMPFIMSAEEGAGKIVRIIERGQTYAVIPWQMAIVARLMHVMPRWLYDRLASGAGRKPRN